jgi:hypothetical protein
MSEGRQQDQEEAEKTKKGEGISFCKRANED